MRNPVRETVLVLVAAFTVILTLAAAPPHAEAKAYSLPRAVVDATVLPNGDMVVREDRTFHFEEGVFHFAYQDLELEGSNGIRDIRVSEGGREYKALARPPAGEYGPPGTFAITQGERGPRVTWYFEAENVTRTFSVTYLVADAAQAWSDTGELYWKFVGDKWLLGHGRVEVTVHLPDGGGAAAGKPRAWGHGPLNGQVVIVDEKTVRFTVDDLPAGQFLEGRILFPQQWLPAATSTGQPRLQAALKEEEESAAAANRTRILYGSTAALSLLLGFGTLVTGVFLYLRYGREHVPDFQGDYFRELPAERPPAEVSYLMNIGSVSMNSLAATLMDLGRRGYVRISENPVTKPGLFGAKTGTDYVVECAKEPDAGLNRHELKALEIVFGETLKPAESVSLKELENNAKRSPSTYQKRIYDWQNSVESTCVKEGVLEPASRRASGANIATSIISSIIILFLFLFGHGSFTLFFVSLLAALLPLLFIKAIKRRSRESANEAARWEGLRRFLLHFSTLDEAPPRAVAMWEHFLVYATALGIAKQVIEQLQVRLPEIVGEEEARRFGIGWFVPAAGSSEGGRSLAGFGSFAAMPVSLAGAVTAVQSAANPSGGGGGFSSGGGGGGGGGGGAG